MPETIVQLHKIPLRWHKKLIKQNLPLKLWAVWSLDISGLNILWLGTLRLKARAKESDAICAKETRRGVPLPTTALVTAGAVRCLIFHLRQPHLLWFSLTNKAIFHHSLGLCHAINQLESETENSPIRPLLPRIRVIFCELAVFVQTAVCVWGLSSCCTTQSF